MVLSRCWPVSSEAYSPKRGRRFRKLRLLFLATRALRCYTVPVTSLSLLRLRPEVARKLAYYVYALIDPRTNEIFYVGKGCRCRVLAHLDDKRESEKTRRIAEIRAAGRKRCQKRCQLMRLPYQPRFLFTSAFRRC